MFSILKRPGDHILIGRQGENLARQIIFDISCWEELYGSEGRAELIYQRPKDAAPYPVVIERDGSTVIWTITSTDTANNGYGRAELRYYIGDTLAKSATSIITVSDALDAPAEVPDPPSKIWLDQVLEAARRAEHAADRAEGGGGSGGSGSTGTDGEDGGYYTPKVSQPTAVTMLVEHTPSKAGMPAVEPVTINLPVGSDSSQNVPLTTAQINALDGMFKVAAYDDSKDVSGAYAAFKAAFGLSDTGGEEPEEPDTPEVKTYTITTELVNVTSSNNEASVNEGASYTATLTAADGYELDTVSVLMGGVNVTADVYADGVISIASVTGNVEIVASAVMSEPGEITDAELLKDGLVDYFDFRNKTVTAGSGGLYYLNSDIGNGYMYSWYNFYFDEYGGKLGKSQTYANNRSTGYPAGENTLSGDVTICLFAKSLAYLYGLSSRNIATNTYNHNWSYKNADGESVSVESVAVTVPGGYNCITFVYSGAVAKLYVNGTVYTEMDCTDKEDFASHNIDWRFGTIDADHYVVAAAVYDRALTEVEVVEMGEYLKTLEVTA